MKMNGITLNMVVKNEEKNIVRCLESVQHLVKEMIIVDTGSTDDTIMMCRSMGAKVVGYDVDKWTGKECVKARNMALRRSTNTWVLSLDADEEMSAGLDIEIRKFIHQSSFDCLAIRRASFFKDRRCHQDAIARLFRRFSDYRWISIEEGSDTMYKHENISLLDNRIECGRVSISNSEIYHFGWYDLDWEEMEEKKIRYEKDGYLPFVKQEID